ncbi:MAG: RluA family pseudouridine synthase [Planctomycetia bacterium]|nr:RluA family pseudouridine synthase [Planctomycetia bacterium]
MLDFIAQDGPVWVINKPPGILVQSPPGIDSLVDQIKLHVKQAEGRPEESDVYVGVPHRLDRPATGAIIFTRNVRAAKRISEQFQMRTVRKHYWVLVEGLLPDESGDWEDFLRKVPGIPLAQIVGPKHPEGRWALLHYRVLQRFPDKNCSWLEVRLETGRTHQIRVQAASRGFPILGDALYGSTIPFGEQFEDERLRAIALHSRFIEIKHPTRDERVAFEAPLSETWRDFVSEDFVPDS